MWTSNVMPKLAPMGPAGARVRRRVQGVGPQRWGPREEGRGVRPLDQQCERLFLG